MVESAVMKQVSTEVLHPDAKDCVESANQESHCGPESGEEGFRRILSADYESKDCALEAAGNAKCHHQHHHDGRRDGHAGDYPGSSRIGRKLRSDQVPEPFAPLTDGVGRCLALGWHG
jgi:hypothetical protein